jgi:uncharacterized protein YqjF (DUF2071 family)
MFQRWHDLLFMHWPLPAEQVRSAMPEALRPNLETYDGQAWVGVIPFWMSHIHARGLPPMPGFSSFPELNVRTYVSVNGVPGVYFFSLDASNLTAVCAARIGYALNYVYAQMRADALPDSGIDYLCVRKHPPLPAEFRGTYRPVGPVNFAEKGSLADFVTNRYCLYAVRGKQILRGHIHHEPWPLQAAEAQVEVNTMAQSHGIHLAESVPVLHFAKQMDVLIWWPERA